MFRRTFLSLLSCLPWCRQSAPSAAETLAEASPSGAALHFWEEFIRPGVKGEICPSCEVGANPVSGLAGWLILRLKCVAVRQDPDTYGYQVAAFPLCGRSLLMNAETSARYRATVQLWKNRYLLTNEDLAMLEVHLGRTIP